MKLLENKTILITGVLTRHSIAYAIAKLAQENGASIILTYQSRDKVKEKVTKLAKEDFADVPIYPLDVTSDQECEDLFKQLADKNVKLDGLVHSLAFVHRSALEGPYHEATTRANFSQSMDVSAYSLTALAKHAEPILNDNASFLTLTYLGAQRVVQNYNVMGVAKAALEASVRYLAASMGPKSYRVNAISAGPIKTLAASGIAGFDQILKIVAQQAPLKRNVSQEEVGNAAVFLLSSMASGVTGEILYVDCGHNFVLG